MAKTSQPTRAPNKALYLTDYARSAWDIGALLATLPALARAPAEMATPPIATDPVDPSWPSSPAPPTPTGAGGRPRPTRPPDDAGRGKKLGHVLE